jgi:hypothetical protein
MPLPPRLSYAHKQGFAHDGAGGKWHERTLWRLHLPLECAGCGRALPVDELVVRLRRGYTCLTCRSVHPSPRDLGPRYGEGAFHPELVVDGCPCCAEAAKPKSRRSWSEDDALLPDWGADVAEDTLDATPLAPASMPETAVLSPVSPPEGGVTALTEEVRRLRREVTRLVTACDLLLDQVHDLARRSARE